MNYRIYFEFKAVERQLIGVSLNGENVGLQTEVVAGHRIYVYELRNYQERSIALRIQNLSEAVTVIISVHSDAGQNILSDWQTLAQPDEAADLRIDLLESRIERVTDSGRLMPNMVPVRRPSRNEIREIRAKIQFVEQKYSANESFAQPPRDELLTARADEPQNTLVDVFYATDRARQQNKSGEIAYTNKRGDLEFGVCQVNVPGNRKKGELPLPPWYLFGLYTNDTLHMSVKRTDQLKPDDFLAQITEKVGGSPEKDALLFIHGFNVGFTESVLRTAQITADIGFRGAPVVYSWPSRKSVFKYTADEATSTGYSIDNIIELIKAIRTETGAERVHLIAHSMGNRFLTDALRSLADQGFTQQFQFNQIILAAPDIDAEVFVKHIAPKIAHAGKQVTLYTSAHDKALQLSTGIHGNIQRAGSAGKQLAVFPGIDTVDASQETTDFLGHGYFAESKPLIHDIFAATRHGHDPAARNLRRRVSGDRYYWDFQ
ncbi:alpha/beta hydrolase [Mucilaginibacter gotjawali]|uniref:Alpha/beta hydrolase family protein n=2 Tax=Mucilaginibacter gotjawali TaxID=1550579 RepID=A0A0X8X4U6_9SPHI|nr:alpha/beta hydrolase [Mucilaginibacter gotjawali]MBB3058724.1 esterase/lipase superfamily enzyme [Mucilaginibacter gotjawali]BAU55671.1 Alpha/beta hydrolase family protein [Mucilaginibacter gotjawali]